MELTTETLYTMNSMDNFSLKTTTDSTATSTDDKYVFES